jgi:hypothetical protein
MGYGEWVGNQSVHFKVVYEDKEGRETGSVAGRDPITLTTVGTNKRRKLSRGTVRVQMRFATLDQGRTGPQGGGDREGGRRVRLAGQRARDQAAERQGRPAQPAGRSAPRLVALRLRASASQG